MKNPRQLRSRCLRHLERAPLVRSSFTFASQGDFHFDLTGRNVLPVHRKRYAVAQAPRSAPLPLHKAPSISECRPGTKACKTSSTLLYAKKPLAISQKVRRG